MSFNILQIAPDTGGGTFTPLPDGDYDVVISGVEISASKAGDAMGIIELTIRKDVHPEHKGRVVKYADYLVNNPKIL
jgi:hypothetical protein